MTMLRQKGGIDPGTTGQMLPGMQITRGDLGADIPVTGVTPATGPGSPLPETGSLEEGTETRMTVPDTAMPIIIDALNETIIGLKVEIHRAVDPEQKRSYERVAEQIRKQIIELGGEPIWADESIEEGTMKLTGHGYVGQQLVPGLPTARNTELPATARNTELPDSLSKLLDPTLGTSFSRVVKLPSGAIGAGVYAGKPQAAQLQPLQPLQLPGLSDNLSEMLKSLGLNFGAGAAPSAPPKITVNEDYINRILGEYGLSPKSSEELQAHAHAIVERQKLGKEQILNRAIEQYERDNPSEFAQQRDRLIAASKDFAAADQEEFASRGMFYSSVMSGAVAERDAATMDVISDIARESASYVLGLREELRDVAEWAVVEEEVVRRELEAEDQALRERLTNIRLQVGMFADQMALDAWHQSESLRLQHQQIAIQGAQAKIQAAAQLGDQYASAFALQDPMVRRKAYEYGYSDADLEGMDITQLAHLGSSILQMMEFNVNRDITLTNQRLIAADTFLKEQQGIEMVSNWQAREDTKEASKKSTKKSTKATSTTKYTGSRTTGLVGSHGYYADPLEVLDRR